MTINSITFIFWFLPIFLILFYICKLNYRHTLVLIASLFVYAWGSVASLCFLIVFILFNYIAAFEVEKYHSSLPLFVALDVIFLGLFKYLNIGAEFGVSGLPLGISFYTFQGISYLIDIKREDSVPAKNPAKLALYLSMFPKMNMGPIVKYKDIDYKLERLNPNSKYVSDGVMKFCVGLCKKSVIAARLAEMTEICWLDAPSSTASAWIGIISFCLQLYYDFSGYSDMAIGLGKMIGFNFGENFLYPFEAPSITEFWRRWHVSLGKWFKDYMYLPMGGNRRGAVRTAFNILMVWLVTGMWHGVGLNFVCWGLFIGILICMEKPIIKRINVPKIIGIPYTFFAFLMSMVFFNSVDFKSSIDFFGYLFGYASAARSTISDRFYFENLAEIVTLFIGATSLPKYYAKQLFTKDDGSDGVGTVIVKIVFILILLVAATVSIVNSGYTPFIYREF